MINRRRTPKNALQGAQGKAAAFLLFPAGNTARRGCRKIKKISEMLFLMYFCMIAQKQRTRTANPGAQPETLQKIESHAQHENPRHIPDARQAFRTSWPSTAAPDRFGRQPHKTNATPTPIGSRSESQKAKRPEGTTHARPPSPSVTSPTAARFFIIAFIYYIIQSIDYMPRYIYILLLYWYFIIEIYILSVFIGNICHLYI